MGYLLFVSAEALISVLKDGAIRPQALRFFVYYQRRERILSQKTQAGTLPRSLQEVKMSDQKISLFLSLEAAQAAVENGEDLTSSLFCLPLTWSMILYLTRRLPTLKTAVSVAHENDRLTCAEDRSCHVRWSDLRHLLRSMNNFPLPHDRRCNDDGQDMEPAEFTPTTVRQWIEWQGLTDRIEVIG